MRESVRNKAVECLADLAEWECLVVLADKAVLAEWVDLASRAAEAVGAEVAGVDLLPARDGRLLVLEVNAVPGWRGLESATGVDVGDAVIRHLENRAATSADAT